VSPARIRTRRTKGGEPRYLVLFRMGGRGFPELTAGTFTTLKEARARRDMVAGELAAGRDPRATLAALTREQAPRRTFRQEAEAMLASRHDLKPITLRRMRYQVARLNNYFGDQAPDTITAQHVQDWITAELDRTKASTLLVARHALRQVLDHAGVDPNPARARSLRWPRDDREEGSPPPAEHVIAMLDRISARYVLAFVTIEQTGMRVGEAARLEWPDLDLAGARARLTRTKTGGTRWAQLPAFVVAELERTPPDDRRGRVFRMTEQGFRSAMTAACTSAGIPHYSPHDLRHRRGTIWHHDGVIARELAHRLGHSSTRETLDTYSHLMPPGDVPAAVLADLVRTRCEQEGR